MSTADLHARTLAIIEAVADLPVLPDDPRYIEAAHRLTGLCRQYLLAANAGSCRRNAESRPTDLGRGIAELHFTGKGVREIARELGVAPSTVSRRLRRIAPTAQRKETPYVSVFCDSLTCCATGADLTICE